MTIIFYKRAFILLILFVLQLGIKVNASDPLNASLDFRYLTNADGLSYSYVSCLAQDDNKLLWIGTSKGLNCYNGHEITRYYNDTSSSSLPHNKVNSIIFTKQKKLFVGTEAGLCVYQDSSMNFKPIKYHGKSLAKIHSITPFKEGQLLVASSKGVYKVSEDKDNYEVEKISSQSNIKGVLVDVYHHLWMFTKEQVIYTSLDMSVIESFEIENDKGEVTTNITAGFIDSSGDVWMGTEYDGLFQFDRKSQQFMLQCKGDISKGNELKYIRSINEDKHNRLWVGTENGLFIYNGDATNFLHYTQSFDITQNSINDNAVHCIYKGQEGIMWIGTYFGGVNYTSLNSSGFYNMIPDGGKVSLKGKAISGIVEDSDQNIWIGTEDKGVSIYSPRTKTYTYVTHNIKNKNSLSGNNVHALLEDKEGFLWVGTYLDGLNKINPKTLDFEIFKHDDKDPNSISDNSIYALLIGHNKEMYVGSLDGVDLYNFENKHFRKFKPEVLGGKHIDDIVEDEKGNVWFSSYNSGLYRYNKEIDSIYVYKKETLALTSDSFISSLIDSQKRLWFGTRGGGLLQYDYKNDQFHIYDTRDGITDSDVYGILEASDGFLWLSTNRGISKFNPITGKVVINYTTEHGIIANQYNFKSYFKDSKGTLYFGSVNGLTYFNPNEVFKKAFKTAPIFTEIKSANKQLQLDSTLNIPANINYAKKITLTSEENELSFGFTLPTFHPIVNADYAYMLEGFDADWKTVHDKYNQVSYTNLDPGKYTFKVKFSNDGNTYNTLERSVVIQILPHPLNTPIAYFIYGLILLLIGYIGYRKIDEKRRRKTASNIAKIEEKKKIELDEHKMNFFTNISHEFKTPLTIILALIEEVSSGMKNMPESTLSPFKTMEKNALRLRFLISQLMEFRQIESDHAPLALSKFDILDKLKGIYNSFGVLYHKKSLESEFLTNIDHLEIVSDEEKIEKIFSNIFSNAYKYSNQQGHISVNISKEGASILVIRISNTGALLSKEDQKRIFDPFFRKEKSIDNTGVGMAIVKSLTTLLSGEIFVETDPNIGNSIIVKLPVDTFKESDINIEAKGKETSFTEELITSMTDDEVIEEVKDTSITKRYNILVAEDNPDLSRHLKAHLSRYYTIRIAHNGEEALSLMQKELPDLVISDVLMPKMGGIELCEKVKRAPEYGHIPVILLTALSSDLDKIEGLKQGADSYMSKPFSFEELKAKINNLLESKNRLKNHFKETGLMNHDNAMPSTNKDEELVKLINQHIKDNIENESFGVEQLADKLNISRSVLYGKIKTLTGLSTVDFMNTIKLNMAKELLSTTNLTITEIAYKTGYSDANYFSRVFKKFHKVSPSEFRKRQKETLLMEERE